MSGVKSLSTMARCCALAGVLGMAALAGCRLPAWSGRLNRQWAPAELPELYRALREDVQEQEAEQLPDERLTMAVDGMPLRVFLAWLADQGNVSVIAAQSLDEKDVTLDIKNEPVDAVLGMLARRLGVQVTRTGRLYFLGELRREDVGVLVRRAKRLDADGLRRGVSVFLSEYGKCETFPDGLVIVGDRVEVLVRVDELLDRVERTQSVTWVVQLFLVSMTERDLIDLGIDALPAVEVAYTFASASSGLSGVSSALDTDLKLKGGLDAVLRAARERESVEVVAEPLLLCVDGGKAQFRRGQKIPVPRRTVSNQGTVSTVGFDTVEAGMNIDIGIREVSDRAARLDVKTELSAVDRFVGDEIPLTSTQRFECQVDVAAGGVYLLGSLNRDEQQSKAAKLLQLGHRRERRADLVQVWARVHRVGMPPAASARPAENGTNTVSEMSQLGAGPARESGPELLPQELPVGEKIDSVEGAGHTDKR